MQTLLLIGMPNSLELMILFVIVGVFFILIPILIYKAGYKSGLAKQILMQTTQTAKTSTVDKEGIQTALNNISKPNIGIPYGLNEADNLYHRVITEINRTDDPNLVRSFTDKVREIYRA